MRVTRYIDVLTATLSPTLLFSSKSTGNLGCNKVYKYFHPNSIHLLEDVDVCRAMHIESQSLSAILTSNPLSHLDLIFKVLLPLCFCSPLYSLETVLHGR